MVEQRPFKPLVGGSSPPRPTRTFSPGRGATPPSALPVISVGAEGIDGQGGQGIPVISKPEQQAKTNPKNLYTDSVGTCERSFRYPPQA